MNTEEKVQRYSKGTKSNTADMNASHNSDCFTNKSAFAKPQFLYEISASSVPLPTKLPSSTAHSDWKERTAGSLSNDKKIGDEKYE
tara:strand:+ start:1587 stop:1844 length:258 start_codon:yes stop_codon:yes gene_type:complete